MRLEWLAAVLRPDDMAPHPNFADGDYERTPAAKLAAAVCGDPLRQGSGFPFESKDTSGASSTFEDTLVTLATQTFQSSTLRDSTLALRRALREPGDLDIAAQCAFALIAANGLGELEEIDECENLLATILQELTAVDPPHALLRCAILQQLSLRKRDWGSIDTTLSYEANGLLEQFGRGTFPDFPISQAAVGDSSDAIRHIVAGLQYAAWSILPTDRSFMEDDINPKHAVNVLEIVKAARSEQTLVMRQQQARQYGRYIERTFRREYGDRSIVLGAAPIDLFYVNLRNELYGSAIVYETRRDLALLRLVQARNNTQSVEYEECLRLLRYSKSEKDLNLALERVRLGGPLSDLSKDARRVMARRLTREYVRISDLRALRSAADLLTTTEAESALAAIGGLIEAGCPSNEPGRWTAFSKRAEETWRTGASLANTAQKTVEFSMLLLEAVKASDYEETLDLSFTRALHDLEFSTTVGQHVDEWLRWLSAENDWRHTASMARFKFRVSSAGPGFVVSTRRDVETVINDALMELPIDRELLEVCASMVTDDLGEIRTWSRQGRFGSGGIEPAASAVSLFYLGVESPWQPLLEFLADDAVPRRYKNPALDRLVSLNISLPEQLSEYFRERGRDLLWRRDVMPVERELCLPYPALLRFLGFYRLLDETDLLAGISRLAGSESQDCRIQAARTIATLCERWPEPWMMAMTLQLSYDPSAEIQGYSANALGIMAGLLVGQAGTDRLIDLMQSDGLIAPLLAVRGLAKSEGRLASGIRELLGSLAREHPSNMVRHEAAELIM